MITKETIDAIKYRADIVSVANGRYLVKWTDHAGDTWLCGYGELMHLTFSETAPGTPVEY